MIYLESFLAAAEKNKIKETCYNCKTEEEDISFIKPKDLPEKDHIIPDEFLSQIDVSFEIVPDLIELEDTKQSGSPRKIKIYNSQVISPQQPNEIKPRIQLISQAVFGTKYHEHYLKLSFRAVNRELYKWDFDNMTVLNKSN